MANVNATAWGFAHAVHPLPSFDRTNQHIVSNISCVFFILFAIYASCLSSSHYVAVHLQGRVLQQELNRLCENGCGELRSLLFWDGNLDRWRVILCHCVLVCSIWIWGETVRMKPGGSGLHQSRIQLFSPHQNWQHVFEVSLWAKS